MKIILKGVAYFLVMIALLIIFLPKVNLYYALEKEMSKQSVYVSDEKLHDLGISFHIDNASVLFDKLLLAKVEQIRIRPWIFYSSIEADAIQINKEFEDFLPSEIKKFEINYWVFNPLYIKLKGESEESFFYGDVDLLKKTLRIHLRLGNKSEKKYHAMLSRLTPEEGGYLYEYKF